MATTPAHSPTHGAPHRHDPGDPHGHGHADTGGPYVAHVLPISVYLAVWVALMVLLAVTYWVGQLNLHAMLHVPLLNLNMVAAMIIATTKAVLVLLYFMHVKYSSRLTWAFVFAGALWLVIMIGMFMIDYLSRGWRY